jgi:hypothetical protein
VGQRVLLQVVRPREALVTLRRTEGVRGS